MEYQDLLKQLRAREYQPVYLLHGKEPYFIDVVVDFIENKVLSPAEQSFNQTIFYGKDTSAQQIVDAARRYPMMAERQVIIVKEAQDLSGGLKGLTHYFKQPTPTTLLVLAHKHKKADARSVAVKAIKNAGVVMESKPLYDNHMPGWIDRYLRDKKLKIDSQAAGLVAEYLGTDLSKVANELDKLSLNLAPGTAVTAQHIEDNIGISREYNVFELQRALAARDVVRSQQIVLNFQQNKKKHPLVMTVASLSNFFLKLFAFQEVRQQSDKRQLEAMGMAKTWQLRDYKLAAKHFNRGQTERAIRLLRDYDLRAKGVNLTGTGDFELGDATPQEELLQELIWQLVRV